MTKTLLGTTNMSFIIKGHINKNDPLFNVAQKTLEELKKNFEKLTGLFLKLQKYDIIKQPNGDSKVVGVYKCYNVKK